LIGQALGNFFRKIFTSPSRQLAKEYGEDEQFFKDICFEEEQESLSNHQKLQLEKLTQVLTEKPQIVIDFRHQDCSAKKDSIHPDIPAKQFEKWNQLISNYLSPFLNDPVNRFTFSQQTDTSLHEVSRKSEKQACCYKISYSAK